MSIQIMSKSVHNFLFTNKLIRIIGLKIYKIKLNSRNQMNKLRSMKIIILNTTKYKFKTKYKKVRKHSGKTLMEKILILLQ